MIVIKRDSGYADKFRKYKVFIDNRMVGTVADGEEKEFNVGSGRHSVYCKNSLYKTRMVTVDDNGKDPIRLNCVNNLRGAKLQLAVFYAFLFSVRGSYIELLPEKPITA
jgi:hypothetical protein